MNFNNNGLQMADSIASSDVRPGQMLRDSYSDDRDFFDKLNYSKHKVKKSKPQQLQPSGQQK